MNGIAGALTRIAAVVAREFLDLRHNPRLILSVYVIPLLLSAVSIPALSRAMEAIPRHHGAHVAASHHPGSRVAASTGPGRLDGPPRALPRRPAETPSSLGAQVAIAHRRPGDERQATRSWRPASVSRRNVLARLEKDPHKAPAFIVVAEVMSYLFIFALFLPLSLGAHAIVGEKQETTLEPLLATPLETSEILVGKAFFAVVPAVLVTWTMYGLQLWMASTVLPGDLVMQVFASATWLLAIFVLVPLLAMFTTLGLVAISARVSDPRTAQQLGVLLLFPLVAGGIALATGLVAFRQLIFGAIAILAIACFILVRLASATFQRDAILTRWR